MYWFPGSQFISLTNKKQQQQIRLRFQETSGTPKILGHLITYYHLLTFHIDCFRFTQTVKKNVSLVIEQPINQAMSMPYYLLLPLSPALLDSSCLDVRLQASIKETDLPGKDFFTATSLQKLAQCLFLSIFPLFSLPHSSFSLSLKT